MKGSIFKNKKKIKFSNKIDELYDIINKMIHTIKVYYLKNIKQIYKLAILKRIKKKNFNDTHCKISLNWMNKDCYSMLLNDEK